MKEQLNEVAIAGLFKQIEHANLDLGGVLARMEKAYDMAQISKGQPIGKSNKNSLVYQLTSKYTALETLLSSLKKEIFEIGD